MEIKLSKKQLKENYNTIVCVSDGNICKTLGLEKTGYNCGVYGWNWSAYDFGIIDGAGRVCLVHGYRSFPAGVWIYNGREFEEIARSNGYSPESVKCARALLAEAVKKAVNAE